MKLHTRLLAYTLTCIFSLAAAGCGQVTYVLQQYDGPVRARDQVSVLRIQPDDPTQLVSLDEEQLGAQTLDSDVRLHIEMLPGKHTLSVKNPNAQIMQTQKVAFVAQPGRVYRVLLANRAWHAASASPNPQGTWSPLVYEVDPDSGRPLQEVSLPPGKS
jgi:hypothetical protein